MQLHRLEEEKEDEDKYVSKARTGRFWTIQQICNEGNWSFYISEPVVCENAASLVSSVI